MIRQLACVAGLLAAAVGAALCMGLLFVLFNLGVDSICLALDPRRRAGGAR